LAKEFRRRLCKGGKKQDAAARAALAYLQSGPEWWKELLGVAYEGRDGAACRLFIALRDGYMNAYANGQSVMRIEFRTDKDGVRPHCSIHHKFLGTAKEKDNYVLVDVARTGKVGCQPEDALKDWIGRAVPYGKHEKPGIALILKNNNNIIDVEMGLPANDLTEDEKEENKQKTAPRMDIVALELHGKGARIVFYEVKCFGNEELRSSVGNPKVLEQLDRYKGYVSNENRRHQVIAGYRHTCTILDAIAEMRECPAGKLIQRVSREPDFPLELDPKPRLIVIDFKEEQAAGKDWERHREALRAYEVIMQARPEDVRLG
jgi:hypothetical protein